MRCHTLRWRGAKLSALPGDPRRVRPAGPAAIDVELVGGRIYRNQLARVCPGLERLERFGAVAITSGAESGRLCRGDRVRIFDAAEARATGLQSFPECVLGDFVPRH